MSEKNTADVIYLDEYRQRHEACSRLKRGDVCVGGVVYWKREEGVAGRWYKIVKVRKDRGRAYAMLRDDSSGLLFDNVPVENLGESWNQKLLNDLRRENHERLDAVVLDEGYFIKEVKGSGKKLLKYNIEPFKLIKYLEKVLEEKSLNKKDYLFMQTDLSRLNSLRMTGGEFTVFDEKKINDQEFRGVRDNPQVHSFCGSLEELQRSVRQMELGEFDDIEVNWIAPVVVIYHKKTFASEFGSEGKVDYEVKPGFSLKQALAGVVVFRFEE